MNKVTIKCGRCGISKKYGPDYATKKRGAKKYCTYCKLIPDDLLQNFKDGRVTGVYKIKCGRCNTDKVYKNLLGFKIKIHEITTSDYTHCTYCEVIPDDLLQNFKDGYICGVYKVKCSKCDNNKTYKDLRSFKYGINRTATKMCRPCSSYKNSHKVRLRQARNIRRREARLKIRQQDPNYYINEAKKKDAKILRWKKRLKAAFVKYRGDNHWFRIKGHFRYKNGKKVYSRKNK